MAQCNAINNALSAKGLNNAGLASQTGIDAGRIDQILSGSIKPTQQEFNTIAAKLGLSSNPGHASQVVA